MKRQATSSGITFLQRSRCLNIPAFCREAIDEKMLQLEAIK